jgi:hypothetical protein
MFHRDFNELLSIFNDYKVKYLVIGGYAVGFHAQPRATKTSTCLSNRTPITARRFIRPSPNSAHHSQD